LTVIYAFDEADADLTLLPMASRRALDAAGLKLSLSSYQTLGVSDRRELARLGSQPQVDVDAVREVANRATDGPGREVPQEFEPVELPARLAEVLEPERKLDLGTWQTLSPLDRYVLDKLHRNGRLDRLKVAFDEMNARHAAAAGHADTERRTH
jgi:hypothetical protein